MGVVYFWFGVLKFFPHLSPADGLAKDTIDALFFGVFPREVSVILLAVMETVAGIMFLWGRYIRITVYLALFHMTCTFTPLIFFPDVSYQEPFVFTIVGQYIVKNIVFVSAMLLLLPEKGKNLKP